MKERVAGGGVLGELSLKGRILLNHRGSIPRKVFRVVMVIGASNLPQDRLRSGRGSRPFCAQQQGGARDTPRGFAIAGRSLCRLLRVVLGAETRAASS